MGRALGVPGSLPQLAHDRVHIRGEGEQHVQGGESLRLAVDPGILAGLVVELPELGHEALGDDVRAGVGGQPELHPALGQRRGRLHQGDGVGGLRQLLGSLLDLLPQVRRRDGREGRGRGRVAELQHGLRLRQRGPALGRQAASFEEVGGDLPVALGIHLCGLLTREAEGRRGAGQGLAGLAVDFARDRAQALSVQRLRHGRDALAGVLVGYVQHALEAAHLVEARLCGRLVCESTLGEEEELVHGLRHGLAGEARIAPGDEELGRTLVRGADDDAVQLQGRLQALHGRQVVGVMLRTLEHGVEKLSIYFAQGVVLEGIALRPRGRDAEAPACASDEAAELVHRGGSAHVFREQPQHRAPSTLLLGTI
mmetsp:Transcript_81127/g.262828  ORF Transcript_81127/g.262828 Transcript_81127/m.262828 type:complete len:368 (-) Transcript_81127:653-1756(-)